MKTEITIAYHLGAPNTDNDQLSRALLKDAKLLAENGVLLPLPRNYRARISALIKKLAGERASAADQDALFRAIVRKRDIDRLILSNSNFMGMPAWMFSGGLFYGNAGKNTAALRNIFCDNPCEFFLGIANPASFIPAAFAGQSAKTYAQFMDGADLAGVRWSDVIADIQQANPGCAITVWSNEDTPIIWPTVLREVAGLGPLVRLAGEQDVLSAILSPEGIELLDKYMKERPDITEIQRRRIRAIFLEKFYLEDAVDEVIDLPGWTEETVEALSAVYEEDLENIERMPGVNFLSL